MERSDNDVVFMARPGQPLEAHLRQVAELTSRFAGVFGGAEFGRCGGGAHDWGKYQEAFQRCMLYGEGPHVNHSPEGAAHLRKVLAQPWGKLFAYIVAGHHSRLPNYDDPGRAVADVLTSPPVPRPDCDIVKLMSELRTHVRTAASSQMFLRMLFSCLVDADRLDAEAFGAPEKHLLRSDFDGFATLEGRFDRAMAELAERARASDAASGGRGEVNACRAEIAEACRKMSSHAPGFFTLEVPTGGGKTLASMAFALPHLRLNGMSRIVCAIPYTSIIEQNAKRYKEIFGAKNVLEHHATFEPDVHAELAAENWDAPLIVTTNVQLFESLLAASASSARKIHNLARSVILLDEAQMLPPRNLRAILDTLKLLVTEYGCTVVLLSATIPALSGERIGRRECCIEGLPEPTAIIADPGALAGRLRRTEVQFAGAIGMAALAERLSDVPEKQVLCIVGTKKSCRELYEQVNVPCKIHLSAAMCPEERSVEIERIRTLLQTGEPVVVISTQVMECGVDLDFPVVYREMAGLDSIAQAGGRCNREGRREAGRVVVFDPLSPLPSGLPAWGAQASREVLREVLDKGGACELGPEMFRRYFKDYYARIPDFDAAGFEWCLCAGACHFEYSFAEFGEAFRMIDNNWQCPVVVRYGTSPRLIEELENSCREHVLSRSLLRRLQRYTVNIPKKMAAVLEAEGCLGNADGILYQRDEGLYVAGRGFCDMSDTFMNY